MGLIALTRLFVITAADPGFQNEEEERLHDSYKITYFALNFTL